MRFITTLRLLEFALIGISLAFLIKASNTKVALYLMAGALGLNLADRAQISRRLEKKAISESERLSTQVEGLIQTVPTLAGKTNVEGQIAHLQAQIETLPVPSEPVDLTAVEDEIASLNTRLSPLVELDPAQIQNDFSSLREEQKQLTQRLEELPTTEGLLVSLEQTTASVTNWAEQLVEHIQTIRPYNYELIDTDKSHSLLFKAIRESQENLILVSPWLSERVIDEGFIGLLRDALKRPELKIQIGWGYWQDTNKLNQAEVVTLNIDAFLYLVEENHNSERKDPTQKLWKYSAVRKLYSLGAEPELKDHLCLKLIGTHQKYLVCDHRFALITSHNFLSAKPGKDDLEMGIRTDDPIVINELIKEFEQSRNLAVRR